MFNGSLEDDNNDGIKNLVDPDWRGQSYGDLNFTLISPFGLALPVECSLMGLDFIPTLALPLAHLVLLSLRRHRDPSPPGKQQAKFKRLQYLPPARVNLAAVITTERVLDHLLLSRLWLARGFL